jgi:hypothetical protein
MGASQTGLSFTTKPISKQRFRGTSNVWRITVHYRHLKPGGWFEQTEMSVVLKSDDGTVPPGSIFNKWGEVSLAAGDSFGKSLRTVDESRGGLIDAGFQGVTEHRFKLPIGG